MAKEENRRENGESGENASLAKIGGRGAGSRQPAAAALKSGERLSGGGWPEIGVGSVMKNVKLSCEKSDVLKAIAIEPAAKTGGYHNMAKTRINGRMKAIALQRLSASMQTSSASLQRNIKGGDVKVKRR